MVIRADDMKKKRQKAIAKQRRDEKRAAEKEKQRAEEELEWAVKELYPKLLAEVEKKIQEITDDPKADKIVEMEAGDHSRKDAYVELLKKDLEGFILKEEWHGPYRCNMGDTEAPCVVDVSGRWTINIRW